MFADLKSPSTASPTIKLAAMFFTVAAPCLLAPHAEAIEVGKMFKLRMERNLLVSPNAGLMVFQNGSLIQSLKPGDESLISPKPETDYCVVRISKAVDYYREISSGTSFRVTEVSVTGKQTTLKVDNPKIESIECTSPKSTQTTAIELYNMTMTLGSYFRASPAEF